jgi:hypothetical protein
VGFQSKTEAETFLAALRERLARFGLELHPDRPGSSSSAPLPIVTAEAGDRGSPKRLTSWASPISAVVNDPMGSYGPAANPTLAAASKTGGSESRTQGTDA